MVQNGQAAFDRVNLQKAWKARLAREAFEP
jgi:hypothetical protein